MTLTFDQESYNQLLIQSSPQVIESEAEYDRALQIVEPLHFKKDRTPEERKLYKLLVLLIEAYEREHYPIPESTPHRQLLHFLEYSSVSQTDLIGIIGNQEEVEALVAGQKEMSQTQAQALSDRFGVKAELFTSER